MFKYIIKDLAITYCSKEIDECCRDSSHYLETINSKQSKNKKQIHIDTADVKNLYRNYLHNET